MATTQQEPLSPWQQWVQHPERSRLRKGLFEIHLWIGAIVGMYVLVMSLSGSIIVFRNELSRWISVERIVQLHERLLLSRETGILVSGIGATCLTTLCLTGAVIWWPGIRVWRRSFSVNWGAHFARITWDLHSALGFWCFLFVLMWGLSGMYFAFPRVFTGLPDRSLELLSELHFGRFNRFTEAMWTVTGLVPGALAFTGVFICCRRVMFKKHSNPNTQADPP